MCNIQELDGSFISISELNHIYIPETFRKWFGETLDYTLEQNVFPDGEVELKVNKYYSLENNSKVMSFNNIIRRLRDCYNNLISGYFEVDVEESCEDYLVLILKK